MRTMTSDRWRGGISDLRMTICAPSGRPPGNEASRGQELRRIKVDQGSVFSHGFTRRKHGWGKDLVSHARGAKDAMKGKIKSNLDLPSMPVGVGWAVRKAVEGYRTPKRWRVYMAQIGGDNFSPMKHGWGWGGPLALVLDLAGESSQVLRRGIQMNEDLQGRNPALSRTGMQSLVPREVLAYCHLYEKFQRGTFTPVRSGTQGLEI